MKAKVRWHLAKPSPAVSADIEADISSDLELVDAIGLLLQMFREKEPSVALQAGAITINVDWVQANAARS